jgi:hypothetical protein
VLRGQTPRVGEPTIEERTDSVVFK